MQVMTPDNTDWWQFIELLKSSEGCNFHERVPGESSSVTWDCDGGEARPVAKRILEEHFGYTPDEVSASLAYFSERGGWCDCWIILNVARFPLGGQSKTDEPYFDHPCGLRAPLLGSHPVNMEKERYGTRLYQMGKSPHTATVADVDNFRFDDTQAGRLTGARSRALHIMRASAVAHLVSIC